MRQILVKIFGIEKLYSIWYEMILYFLLIDCILYFNLLRWMKHWLYFIYVFLIFLRRMKQVL